MTQFRLIALMILVIFGPSVPALGQSTPPPPAPASPPASPLTTLNDADRARLDALIGFAVADIPAPATWINSEPFTLNDLRGSLVVIQTWNSRAAKGTIALRNAVVAHDKEASDVKLLLVHTPDLSDRLNRVVETSAAGHPVLVDQLGTFCDAIGAFRTPVNVIIDRHGIVRGAGLTPDGTHELLAQLRAEPFDPEKRGLPKPEVGARTGTGNYPPTTTKISRAKDVRNKKMPLLNLSEWWNGEPDLNDRVLVVDFWATWCGPCVAGIPRLNDLQDRFADDIVVIGLTAESPARFAAGVKRIGLSPDDFHYPVALDHGAHTQTELQMRGLPHMVVIGRDGIVRWQGHPRRLTAGTITTILAADGRAGERGRWSADLARQAARKKKSGAKQRR